MKSDYCYTFNKLLIHFNSKYNKKPIKQVFQDIINNTKEHG